MCKDVTYIWIFLIVLKKSAMITIRKRADIDLISSKLVTIGHSRKLRDEQTMVKQCNGRTKEFKLLLRTWCFSDRASWIDYILITNFDALIIIYS